MKLSKLRSAIRTTSGNPSIYVRCATGVLNLTLQKTPLLAALGDAFDNDQTTETGLDFDSSTGTLYGPWFTTGVPEYDADELAKQEGRCADDGGVAALATSMDDIDDFDL